MFVSTDELVVRNGTMARCSLIGGLTAAVLAAGVVSSTPVAATDVGTIAFRQKSFDDASSRPGAAAADGTRARSSSRARFGPRSERLLGGRVRGRAARVDS